MKKGELVTIPLDENNNAANTYIVYADLGEEVILQHPLHQELLISKSKEQVNSVAANMKDSMERCINFIMKYKKYLDFNSSVTLESIILYFIIHKRLTGFQKKTISKMCGMIAEHYFNDDLHLATKYVNENKGLLDDYNLMWYKQLESYFTGKTPVDSKKLRLTIFNIAGYVLAELESQSFQK